MDTFWLGLSFSDQGISGKLWACAGVRSQNQTAASCSGSVLRLYGYNLIWIIPAKGSCLPNCPKLLVYMDDECANSFASHFESPPCPPLLLSLIPLRFLPVA